MMTVSYTMTQADHWAVTKFLYTHDRGQATRLILCVLVMPLAAVASTWQARLPLVAYVIAALISLVVWSVFLYAILRFKTWSEARAWPAGFRTIELTLADDGLHITTPKSTNMVDWSGVPRVGRDRKAIYLFISPRLAYIAPVRAFASAADMDAFQQFATSHIKGQA
jgi:hypothetical protein